MAITRSNGAIHVLMDAGSTVFHQKLNEMKKAWAKRRLYNQTYAQLAAMSDRNLKDLGISRSGIKRMAMEAVYDL